MQRVADADLPLDLRVRQRRHDGAALHVGPARRYVPGGHAQPQLGRAQEQTGHFDVYVYKNVHIYILPLGLQKRLHLHFTKILYKNIYKYNYVNISHSNLKVCKEGNTVINCKYRKIVYILLPILSK